MTPTTGTDDGSRTFLDALRALRKHRWLAAGVFLLTVVLVGLWSGLQVPIYQSAATVLIDPEPPRVLNIQEVTPIGPASTWDPNYYPTQYEIIRSRPVVDKAIAALNLTQRMPGLASARQPYAVVAGGLAVEPKRNTRLIQIRYEHSDPALAA